MRKKIIWTLFALVQCVFTEQNRNWFQKKFMSVKSTEYPFNAKVQLPIFNKT